MELLTVVFRQLVSLAVTALPVIAVVLGVRWLLAKLNAPKKYSLVLWCAVWLRLVCPVKWRVRPWSIFNLRPLERVAEYGEAVAAVSSAASAPAVPVVTAPAADISVPAAAAAAAVDWQALAWQGAAVVWLAGLAALLVYGVWSWLRLRRQVSAAVWNGGNVWECDAIPTPFVLGYVHPRIYIPFRLDSNERTYVLAHERYHLRWGDQWWKLLSCLVLAVYWWDAAVWLCWVLFCRDLEMRCDEAVLAQLGDQVKGGYSLSLVSFAMERRFPAALAFGEHDAARRVKHVLAWKKETPRMAFLGVAVVLVVFARHPYDSAAYLLVVRGQAGALPTADIRAALDACSSRIRLRMSNSTAHEDEMTWELYLTGKGDSTVENLRDRLAALSGISSINIVSYAGETLG